MQSLRALTIRIFYKGPQFPVKAPIDHADPLPPSYQLESPTHSHRAPPKSPSSKRFRWRYALAHMMALLGSGLMIAAMVLLLREYENKPAPQWKQHITLNTALSWLGVLGKLALMVPVAECIGQMKWVLFGKQRRKLSDLDLIDGVSRDVFGAVGWIMRFRGGYALRLTPITCGLVTYTCVRFFVHLGAAFVIASLGFDPAVQQLISYDLRSAVDTTQTGTVSTNRNYTPTRGFDRGLILAVPRALLWGAQSSVLGSPVQPSWDCPTGNCDYPETVSVGVCQVCTEITPQIDRNCQALSEQKPFCQGSDCFTTGQLCTYTYNNASVGGGQTLVAIRADPVESVSNDGKVSIPSKRIDMTTLYIQPDESLRSTQSLPIAPGYIPPNGSHVARAFSCGISYCQQTFHASVVNGKYSENITATSQLASYVLPVPKLEDIGDQLLNTPIPIAPGGATNVSLAGLFAMSNGLTSVLTGSAKAVYEQPNPGESISEFHRGLYEKLLEKDFSTVMAGIAMSMSHAVRDDDNKQSSRGIVNASVLYVRIHWTWLAFPATLWFVGLILIAAVTLKCYSKDTMVGWLGHSQIAGLFLGLENEVRTDVDNSGVVGGRSEVAVVRAFAEKVKLRLGVVEGRGEEAIRVKFCRRGGW